MYWKKIKNDLCVEVLAMDEEGTKVIIREIVGDKGIHETYVNIYDKLIIQKEQMEAYVQDVFNRYDLGKKGLDIEEQKLVKDIVLGMLEIASKRSEERRVGKEC